MNIKKITIILILTFAVLASAEQVSVDVTSGKAFNRSVVGMNRTFDGAIELANEGNSVMRGPAGGGRADMYDWKKNTGNIPYNEPVTLDLLIESRDSGSELVFTANMVGTGPLVRRHDDFVWENTDINFLSDLAADWVRYVNYIVPTYRQGDTLPSSDQAILDEIDWSPKLLPAGAPATLGVEYWEIGNEVERYDDATFISRYKSISEAMLSEDSSIKVGPCIIPLYSLTEDKPIRALLQDPSTQIDFISYHPYHHPYIGDVWDSITQIEEQLRNVSAFQRTMYSYIYDAVATDRGTAAADAMEYLVTEWNAVGYNHVGEQRSIASALSAAETIFTLADLDVRMGCFWPYTRDDYFGEYPIGKVFRAMAEYMGDTLVSVYPDYSQFSTSNNRLYVTKDSLTGRVAVWALNFSNDTDWDVNVNLSNASLNKEATIMTLDCLQEDNVLKTLHSPGVNDVYWNIHNASGLDYTDFDLTVPAASIKVVLIDDESADQSVPTFLADPNDAITSLASQEDIFANTWTAYEVDSDKVGVIENYTPMEYSFATESWLGTSAEFSAVLNNGVINQTAEVSSYVETSSLTKVGVLAFEPRMEAKVSFNGFMYFYDESGTSGGTVEVRQFTKEGDGELIKSISVSDGAAVDLSQVAELQNVNLDFGEKITFEVEGSTTGYTYSADFTEIKVIDLTCWKLTGDINEDCEVNFADFEDLAQNWLIN